MATSKLSTPTELFIMIMTEFGDLFKIVLTVNEKKVEEMEVHYFDSLTPCSHINVLPTGHLFTTPESGDE